MGLLSMQNEKGKRLSHWYCTNIPTSGPLYLLFPPTWYILPSDARTSASLRSFRFLLKCYFSRGAFPVRVAISPSLPLPIHCILLYLSLIAFTTAWCILWVFYCLFLLCRMEHSEGGTLLNKIFFSLLYLQGLEFWLEHKQTLKKYLWNARLMDE